MVVQKTKSKTEKDYLVFVHRYSPWYRIIITHESVILIVFYDKTAVFSFAIEEKHVSNVVKNAVQNMLQLTESLSASIINALGL